MFYKKQTYPNITYRVKHSFRETVEDWSTVLPKGHHLVSPDIEALELSKPEDIRFMYVDILENDVLIGVMYLQCLHFNSKHYDHKIFERPVLKHLQGFIKRQRTRILVCGNLFRVDFQGFYFKDKSRREMIFNCLHEFRRTYCRDLNFKGVLVKDCSREFNEIQFGCHSFRSFTQDLTMELDVKKDWSDFNDYLRALSRKYCQRALKIQAAQKDIELIDLSLTDLFTYKEELYTLYMNIVKNQSLALGILSPDYFIQMKSYLDMNFKVFAYKLGDRILAFSSHIYYPAKNRMEIHYIGIDYMENPKYQLYFNILFDGIKMAISRRFDKIEMGRTAREAKANAGALPVENFNYVWVKPGITSLVVSFLGKWFEGNIGEDWQKRHPFKTAAGTPEVQE